MSLGARLDAASPLAFDSGERKISCMNLLFLTATFLTGAVIAMQPGINAGLSKALGSPFQASLVSFTTGTLVMLVISLTRGLAYPRPAQLAHLPVWQVLGGGALGALYVTLALVLAPRVGATLFLSALVAGQMTSSLLLDHQGWLGFKHDPATAEKLAGALLVIVGVWLISRR